MSRKTQDLYVSFTHRQLPPVVLVAMGFFSNSAFSAAADVNATMPLTTQNYGRAWKSSNIIPFLANVAVEKMRCDSYGRIIECWLIKACSRCRVYGWAGGEL
jgi:hypothetical protein